MAKVIETSRSRGAKLDGVSLKDVTVKDAFWSPRLKTNRLRAIPHQWREAERTGRVDNFRVVAGLKKGRTTRHLAADSDLYKWAEAVSYDLNACPDTPARPQLDELVGLIARAQDRSGYIDMTFQLDRSKWWVNLDHGHELYCGGHLLQAAVAHHRATGSGDLLAVATRWADYVHKRYGPKGRPGTGGHPEVEMALVELYRETRDKRYLDLASRFVELRGATPRVLCGSPFMQDHLPIREQREPTGHAVRQLYLASGVTDIHAETGDASLLETMKALWKSFTQRRMYVTGGAGARYAAEDFGVDWELPNRTAYSETCAAIASMQWNWRMLGVTGHAQYADIMELALYSGWLPGVSLDGRDYFYTNPLEHDGGQSLAGDRGANRRTSRHWNIVPCCPPNVARTMASLGGYIYGSAGPDVYVHLYVGSSATVDAKGGPVRLGMDTRYPCDGKVAIAVDPGKRRKFAVMLRIPGWARSARVKVNGRKAGATPRPGSYLRLSRNWSPGDRITIDMPMPVERIVAERRIAENDGRVTLKRGPVVYSIEWVDHAGVDLFDIALPDDSQLEASFDEGLLGGVVALKGAAALRKSLAGTYPRLTGRAGRSRRVKLTAVPYYAWANRRRGAMRVWIPRA